MLTSVFGCTACPSWAADGTIAHVMLALADDKELRAPFFSCSVECDLGPGHPRIPSEAENGCQLTRDRLQISSIHLHHSAYIKELIPLICFHAVLL